MAAPLRVKHKTSTTGEMPRAEVLNLAATIGLTGLNRTPAVTGFQAQKSESSCTLVFWLRSSVSLTPSAVPGTLKGPFKVYGVTQVFKVLNRKAVLLSLRIQRGICHLLEILCHWVIGNNRFLK